jgi:hypothetical protein
MSDGGIGTISKGDLQKAIEKVANNPQLRSDFLAALKGTPTTPGTDWLEFLRNTDELDIQVERYVRDTWQKTFWSQYPVEPIMRQSLIEAIELADSLTADKQNPMPIDCYWIYTNDPDKFEALITYNARQVTRIILTPPPPPPNHPPLLTGKAPFWIVKPANSAALVQEEEVRRDPEGQWITMQLKAPE